MTLTTRVQDSSGGTAHVKGWTSMVVASFLLLQACAVPSATVATQDAPGKAEPVSMLADATSRESAEPVATEASEPRQQSLLSPEAKRNIGLCLLAGPLCAGLLLYVGVYAATFATVCTPVAAITTPMGSSTFQEEFAHCMKSFK